MFIITFNATQYVQISYLGKTKYKFTLETAMSYPFSRLSSIRYIFYCHFLSCPRSISFAILRRHCHKSIDSFKLVNAAGSDKARCV